MIFINNKKLKILLADDDVDDHFFFNAALKEIDALTKLLTLENGEQLMDYLFENTERPPDILFVGFNMPRKNGAQCLMEIKRQPKLYSIPVIIYSAICINQIADILYKNSAHYFFKKDIFVELKSNIQTVFSSIINDFTQRCRKEFILGFKQRQTLIFIYHLTLQPNVFNPKTNQ